MGSLLAEPAEINQRLKDCGAHFVMDDASVQALFQTLIEDVRVIKSSVTKPSVTQAEPSPDVPVFVYFSDDSKGIALNGCAGQSVLASANGQVSYVGNSLRGYGKMIVIKHEISK